MKINTPCQSCGREENGHWFKPCPSDDCPSHTMKTKTTEHTPGPWKAEPSWSDTSRLTISAGISQTHRGLIASTDGTPFLEQEQANARLIAAAPEMLAALQKLARLADEGAVMKHETGKATWSILDEIKLTTSAALALAGKGEG